MKDDIKLPLEIEALVKALLDHYRGDKVYTRQSFLTDFIKEHYPEKPEEKKSYTQDWPLYDKAMRSEKLMFFRIIKDAVDFLNLEYKYKGNGRPQVDYSDIVKCLCIKSFNNYSSWRCESELKIAKSMGIIDNIYRRATLNKYLASNELTPILHRLYKTIAEPLKVVELTFSVDSTGISHAYGKKRWVEVRSEYKQHKDYRKLHIMTGNKTNVICSAVITDGRANDSPYFKPLVDDTAKIFSIKEIVADAGYLSRKNAQAAQDIGARPFIMPKKNVRALNKGEGSAWGNMIHLWKDYQMLFARHYHQRSNVESTFGMLKRKWGHFCRAKLPTAQENEILCKIICHNISVLSEALLAYNLEPEFMVTL